MPDAKGDPNRGMRLADQARGWCLTRRPRDLGLQLAEERLPPPAFCSRHRDASHSHF